MRAWHSPRISSSHESKRRGETAMLNLIGKTVLTSFAVAALAAPASAQQATRAAAYSRTAAAYSQTAAPATQQGPSTPQGTLTAVNQGGVSYRWTRGNLSIDLANGQRVWSAGDAQRISDSL